MSKITGSLMMIMVLVSCPFLFVTDSTADSFTYNYSPSPADMYDLDHATAYMWGINLELAEDEVIVEANLFFDDISNYRAAPNDLFLNLIDNSPLGLTEFNDSHLEADNYFVSTFNSSSTTFLYQAEDLPDTPVDLTYSFTSTQLTMLSYYLRDNNFGLGVDPDCHYDNNGVTLTIHTTNAPVPEPATMLLLGVGLSGIALTRKLGDKKRNL